MAHECPDCGDACYCDGEDTWWDDYDECEHGCEEIDDDDPFDDDPIND